MSRLGTLLCSVLLGLTLGCTHVHLDAARPAPVPQKTSAHRGPPPHAPAHGYRHKYPTRRGGVELRFDSGLGVYVVVGRPGHYFGNDRFYRLVDGTWTVSAHLDHGWISVSASDLPRGLRKDKQSSRRRNGRPTHPAKHR